MHKLENAEEDIVFLQTDINELKEEKSETEIRLRAELTSLQAEMSAISMFNSYYYSAQILDTFFVLQHIVAFYTVLTVLVKMKKELGLEAMLEYMAMYLNEIDSHNPKLSIAVAKTLENIPIEVFYHELGKYSKDKD